MDIRQYNNEMNNIKWTEDGKQNLLNRVQETASSGHTKKHGRTFARVAVIAAVVSVITVTGYATGIVPSASEVFGPIFGTSVAQTEIIDKIGMPIGASDTDKGITITADAIIGDSSSAIVVYSISNEDGTLLALPEGVEHIFFNSGWGTQIPIALLGTNDFKGFRGSMHTEDINPDDNTIQIIETLSTSGDMPIGGNVTATFENICYLAEDGEIISIVDGEWKINYKLDYEDSGITIPVNTDFTRDELTFTVNEVTISPVSILANYAVNAVPNLNYGAVDDTSVEISTSSTNNTDNTEESSGALSYVGAPSDEYRFLGSFELIITKQDGTVIDLTDQSGGGLSYDNGITKGHKSTTFDEILPLEEIATITVGDIVIDVADYID